MFKKLILAGLVSLLLGFLAFVFVGGKPAVAQKEFRPLVEGEYAPNQVLVKFKEGTALGSIQKAINFVQGEIITNSKGIISLSQWNPEDRSHRSFRLDPNLFHLKVLISTEQAIYILSQLPIVDYAEENGVEEAECETLPNDPEFPNQLSLKRTDNDCDIDAPDAWDKFTGSSDIIVAVLDSGMTLTHEDLAANLWINSDDVQGDGADNDGNGYVDDTYGYDFASILGTGIGRDSDPSDETGHGTGVAGVIGAVGNNGKGVAGINWDVTLMAVRVFQKGRDYISDMIAGIDYAIENGAHILNISGKWTKSSPPQALKEAVQRAMAAGILVVAAAGNEDGNNDVSPKAYPASYDLENIIAVLATDENDKRAVFETWASNYGAFSVDLGAPCVGVRTTAYPSGYGGIGGTSAATPHVSGVAALLWGKLVNRGISWHQVKDAILDNVDPKNSLIGYCVTGGRLNANNPFEVAPPNTPSGLTGTPRAWTIIDLSWNDESADEFGFETYRKKEGESDYSYRDFTKKDDTEFQDNSAAEAGNINYYKVRAYNLGGNSSFTSPISVTIPTGAPCAPLNLDGWCTVWSVMLHWYDAPNNEQFYAIERKSEWEPWWEEIEGYLEPNSEGYEDYDVMPDTWYYYRVRAHNPDGYSPYSNVFQVYVF